METAVAPMTTFQVASWSLRKRRKPTFSDAVSRLKKVGFLAKTVIILKELNPEKHAELQEKFRFLGDDIENEEVIYETLAAICGIAPIDMQFYDNVRYDDMEFEYLYPESCGFPMGWDEWGEIASNPTDCNDSMALFIFFTALRLGEGEVLERASERFGWNLPEVDLEQYDAVDWEKLYALLVRARLGCFNNAIDVCLYSTGNPYFDYNPYDEEVIPDLPPYSLEGVREMQDMWEAAKPINADFDQAKEMFEEDPEKYSWTLLKLWLRCCKKKKRERVRLRTSGNPGRTLGEIWGEIEDNQRELDRLMEPLQGLFNGREEEE
jgi:hypothetical protein